MKRSIVVVGGTHGNELVGIGLVRRWLADPAPLRRDGCTVTALLGNPLAVERNVRYVDEDLNRAFGLCDVRVDRPTTWEARRARELDAQLGPKLDHPKTDVLIDLHTTTADMGVTLIIYENPFNLAMAAHVQRSMPDVRIYLSDKRYEDTIGLQSIAPCSMLVEIGPVPHGVLRHQAWLQMEAVVRHALDYIAMTNRDPAAALQGEVEVFRRGTPVPYPLDAEGRIAAMVHQDLQHGNFRELLPGAPLFACFDGRVIRYDGGPGWYPVFINEAAYYAKNLAMRLNRREIVRLHPGAAS